MAFTYDITTDRGKVRRWIGDTAEGAGPLPDSSNFQDDEIDSFLDQEGGHVRRAATAGLEALANVWAAHVGRYELGPEDEEYYQAKTYNDLAKRWREAYGVYRDDTALANQGGAAIEVLPAGAS